MPTSETQSNTTVDSLFDGALELLQPASGYRFSIDALLLAGAVESVDGRRVLDLGCGCGVAGMAISHFGEPAEIVGVEIQTELADLARRNIDRNKFETPIRVITGDVRHYREFLEPNAFDAVVCNPPYYPVESGRINPDAQRAVARHEIEGTLDDFLRAARYGLEPRGVVYLVYPAFRLAAMMASLAEARLHAEWLQFVQPRRSEAATLTLCRARLGGSARLVIRPPLAIHDGAGHTPIVASLLAGRRLPYPGE